MFQSGLAQGPDYQEGALCLHNKDCSTSAWCEHNAYEQYCLLNGNHERKYCPWPHCFWGTPAPTTQPTVAPTNAPTWGPLGDVQADQGCSNAADLTIVTFDGAEAADGEACKAACDAHGMDCNAAAYTLGWVAWGNGETSGGYTDVFASQEIQDLLANTCKISPCTASGGIPSNCGGECHAAGTHGCPADEPCMSVGPASAGCGGTIPAHTALECENSSSGLIGTLDLGDQLVLNTHSATCPGVSSPQCQGNPHAESCFGPYQDSEAFAANEGDEINWTYLAVGGDDWYEVMVIILRDGVPVAIPTYRFGDAIADYRTDYWTVDETSANYVIRFVVGSYDWTGGTALGARMEVSGFGLTDSDGNGYALCRLLTEGCDQVQLTDGELATRSTARRRFEGDVIAPVASRLAKALKL